jgi:glycosyltransferase involved in cell wall biosynthesis
MSALHKAGFPASISRYAPNGVPLPSPDTIDRAHLRARLGLNPASFVAVSVGRLTAPKTPETLLDAWAELHTRFPSSQLLFVGDGEKRPLLEAKTRQGGLQGSVVFTGQVRDVDDYLKSADIFVLPSASEGMPLALLEAMAAGLPVIVSRVGGIIDIIRNEDNGLVFEPGDTKGLVRCLSMLMESPERRRELGRRAWSLVKTNFSLEKFVDAYIDLYRSV